MNKLYILLFLFFPITLVAQKYDANWVYVSIQNPPNNLAVRMNFNNLPIQITTDTAFYSSIASELVSISDSVGNFLFYSNGNQVCDRNFQLMPNGNNLNAGYINSIFPYTEQGHPVPEGMIVVPNPDSSFLFEIFHLQLDTINGANNYIHKLLYSRVDMRLNNNLGDISIKNQFLVNNVSCCQLEAVKHANGKDWWILVPESTTNGYYSFLVRSDTIEGPFYQQVGPAMSISEWGGQANFSPDGTKYVRYRDSIDLFNFDRCTGELCNPKHYPIDDQFYGGGCAFSPNSRFLYISSGWDIYQVDTYDPDIASGIINIASFSPDSLGVANIMLAPDGKIYGTLAVGMSYISAINNPDSLGISCDFQYRGAYLPIYCTTLPNFPHYRTPPLASCPPCVDDTTGVYVVQKEEEGFNIYPNPAHTQLTVQWLLEDNKTGYRIQIYNTLGQIVHNETVIGQNGQHSLDVSKWMNGIYFLSLYDGGKLIGTKTFSIAH